MCLIEKNRVSEKEKVTLDVGIPSGKFIKEIKVEIKKRIHLD